MKVKYKLGGYREPDESRVIKLYRSLNGAHKMSLWFWHRMTIVDKRQTKEFFVSLRAIV